MNSKVEIVRQGDNGGFLRITADCQTREEIAELIGTCRQYAPRVKWFGII